jgi:imidazolonepropionase-like amidohydrolase
VFLADRVWDGTDQVPIEGAAVVVQEGRVAAVGRSEDVRFEADDEQRRLGPGTVLPGLIDMHFHVVAVDQDLRRPAWQDTTAEFTLRGARNARIWLERGVTTARNVGALDNLDMAIRDAILEGLITGPRMYCSGSLITQVGGMRVGNDRQAIEVTGPDEARRATRQQIKAGADLLKIYGASTMAGGGGRLVGPPGWPQLDEEEMRAIVEEGLKANRPAACHAVSTESIKNAARARVQTIEHATYLDDEAIDLILAADITIVPTLSIGWSIIRYGAERGFPQNLVEMAKVKEASAKESVRRAYEAGIKIAAGTDADNSHLSAAGEAILLADAGLSNKAALRALTGVAAAAIGRGAERLIGTLEPGKAADFVVIDGDPLRDLGALERVTAVVQGGVVVRGTAVAIATAVPV